MRVFLYYHRLRILSTRCYRADRPEYSVKEEEGEVNVF